MNKILKDSIIFNKIEDKEMNEILLNLNYIIKKYKNGSNISFRGEEIRNLLIIIKGSVMTEMISQDGNIKKIEELKVSDVLAPAFIFGNDNHFPVDLVAKGDVEIFSINKIEFLRLLSSNQKILENFLNEISNKTQLLSIKIWKNFSNKTIKDKFNDYVMRHKKNNEFTIRNLKELADDFGVARPSLSRVLSEYIGDETLKRIGRNKYKILNDIFFED